MRRKTISLRTPGVAAAVVLLAIPRVGGQSVNSVTFTNNGPAGLNAHNHDGPNPWAGAISAVVPDPGNPDVMWIGAVNGGVWKTTDATHANPTWIPLTDHEESLSIGALALDSGDANVLVAGIGGHASQFYGTRGPLTGLLRTTDGGNHWDPLGQARLAGEAINGVVVNGNGIIVSSGTGIWRSDDTGATFYHLGLATTTDCGKRSNIVRQPVTALVGDTAHLNFIYAAIPGSPGGVYASVDYGCSWDDISIGGTFGQPSGENLVADASLISLTVHDDGRHEAVYAAILDQDRALKGVFRSANGGATLKPRLLIDGLLHLDELSDPTLATYTPYPIPIAAHALNPNRLVIATGRVYESDDGGDTLTLLRRFTGTATRAIAFGSTGLRNILYVGGSDGLFRHRTKFGAMHHLDSYNFGVPVVMALDPADWQSAWVVNADPGSSGVVSGNSIWHTSTGGVPKGLQDTWNNVTGNLGPDGAGAQQLHAIAFAPGSSASVIFVGARDGLYAMSTARPGRWFKLHGALPNTIVYDLDYDATDDLLLIATLGRGTWTMASPGNISLPTALDVARNATVEVQVSPVSAR